MWFLCDKSFLVLGTQVNDSLPSNTVCDIVELRSQYTMVTCISFVQWNASNVDMVETTTACLKYGGVHISVAPGIFSKGGYSIMLLNATKSCFRGLSNFSTLVRNANVCNMFTKSCFRGLLFSICGTLR